MSQQFTPYSLGTQKNAAKHEMCRHTDDLANYLGVCMEILRECYAEASDIGTDNDRKEILQSRFDFILSYIDRKAVDLHMISKEIAET